MKKIKIYLSLAALFLVPLLSTAKISPTKDVIKPTHREHKAHVHGAAQLSLAFDGLQGEMTYDGASINIYGFEHSAKSGLDKKAQAEAFAKLEKNIAQMVQLETSRGCQFTEAKAMVEQEGPHSDVNAKYKITCARSPVGSLVKIDFGTFFPSLTRLNVQVIADNVQKEVRIEKFPTEFTIQ